MAQVKMPEDIFRGLDSLGCKNGLPFMPEMLQHCGKSYRIWRRVEKTCVEGDRIRRLKDVVFLEDLRCDGSAHDGCQRRCTIFWHEAWLIPVDPGSGPTDSLFRFRGNEDPASGVERFTHPTRTAHGTYVCQSTELLKATSVLARLDPRQYFRDVLNRTFSIGRMVQYVTGPLWRWMMEKLFRQSPWVPGPCRQTPIQSLSLQPGEWVMVKSREEIIATLDARGRNRGLEFTPLMLPFCGLPFRVKQRVARIILETTGKMQEMENTVVLEGVTCDGFTKLGGCPRASYHLWREIWLQRVSPGHISRR
jgi:hypothetical protein